MRMCKLFEAYMQVLTANYWHLWSPVNMLTSGGNKKSYTLKVLGFV